MDVTKETRLESYIQRPVAKRQRQILDTLGDDALIARQIADRLGYNDLNAVKPRLTELKQLGLVVSDHTAYDTVTKRNVAIWRKKR